MFSADSMTVIMSDMFILNYLRVIGPSYFVSKPFFFLINGSQFFK